MERATNVDCQMGLRRSRKSVEQKAGDQGFKTTQVDVLMNMAKQEEWLKLARSVLRAFCRSSGNGDGEEMERRCSIEQVRKMGWWGGGIDRDENDDHGTSNYKPDGDPEMDGPKRSRALEVV